MKKKIFITEDGSSSIYVEDLAESYHSHFGALAESQFVYIESGLKYSDMNPVSVLEIGFGTGLNALLTWNESVISGRKTSYYTIEKYPLSQAEWEALNYQHLESIDNRFMFNDLHQLKWNEWHNLDEYFHFFKSKSDLQSFVAPQAFDIIYFDAFSPDVQPELWTDEIFSKLYRCLRSGGILLTYSVKGSVKRTVKSVGFKIELLPGPKGKREIMRACK